MKDCFDKFSWLHYDELDDRAFCRTCITAHNKGHTSTVIDTIEPTFSSTGYTNWKDALVKKRGFAALEQAHCHKHVVMCAVTIPAATGDIDELINDKYADKKAFSCQSLLKILWNIPFLARQAPPMGCDGKGESNSNFNQLYH